MSTQLVFVLQLLCFTIAWGTIARLVVWPARTLVLLITLTIGCTAPSGTIRLEQPSPHSLPEPFATRRGVELTEGEREALRYELPEESFETFSPAEPAKVRALLVWVAAGNSGAPPAAWAPTLLDRGIAWLAANGAGNQRASLQRLQLALDAASHARRLHPGVECYVGGFSGGARIASELALLYPDVFKGALLIGAADFYRTIESSDPRWPYWKAAFPPPPLALLGRARQSGRYVLVTGKRDFNRHLMRDVYRALLGDGFSGARFVEIPNADHELPGRAELDRALALLLSP